MQTAVVAGGGGDIGAAISKALAARELRVAVLDIDPTAAEQVAADLPSGYGQSFECDLTSPPSVAAAMSAVRADLGEVAVVVSNVGWTPNKPFSETSWEEQKQIIEINYGGPLNIVREVLDDLRTASSGRLIFVSSDAARVGTPKEAVYAGAKAGLIAFAKSLAIEVAREGVTVNVVSPGTTRTSRLESMLTAEQIDRRVRANPMRRLAEPGDVAGAVGYFAGPEAAYLTGQVLSVNGGMSRVD